MKTLKDSMVNVREETELQEFELTDLGQVSEETRGTHFGSSWDGGFAHKLP